MFPFLPVNSLLLFLMCLHFSLPAYILASNRNFCNVNNNSVNFLFSSFGYNKLIKTKERCQTAA
ncbi:hypothetical protein DW813_12530 [Roseburia inulinivorans]|uniref:Uncharacterized protein n=1 Tax=Roseburia inulinivorans TaxID=360807 RepID=A0A396ADE3_9FIRM|nr:hypothetical protein DW813_12530 [Roseburia inulinivorans]